MRQSWVRACVHSWKKEREILYTIIRRRKYVRSSGPVRIIRRRLPTVLIRTHSARSPSLPRSVFATASSFPTLLPLPRKPSSPRLWVCCMHFRRGWLCPHPSKLPLQGGDRRVQFLATAFAQIRVAGKEKMEKIVESLSKV